MQTLRFKAATVIKEKVSYGWQKKNYRLRIQSVLTV